MNPLEKIQRGPSLKNKDELNRKILFFQNFFLPSIMLINIWKVFVIKN